MFLPLAYFITPSVHMVFSLFMYWNIISHVPRKMHACSLNKHCVPPSEQALHVFTYMNSVGTVREQITFFQWYPGNAYVDRVLWQLGFKIIPG